MTLPDGSRCAWILAWIVCGVAGCNKNTNDPRLVGPLAPTETRAGEIRSAKELLSGPKAEGRLGDYKLINERVSFVVEGARPSSGYLAYGGLVVDAVREGQGGGSGQDSFEEAGPVINLQAFRGEKVEIVNPGGSGIPAVIKVRGSLAPVPIVADLFPLQLATGAAAITYTLEPGASDLRMDLEITNSGSQSVSFQVGAMFLFGDYVKRFVPGVGFDSAQFGGRTVDLFGGVGRDVSYGWASETEDTKIAINILDVFVTIGEPVSVAPGASLSLTRRLVVAGGTVEELLEARDLALGRSRPRGIVEGRIVGLTAEDLAHTEVHVLSEREEGEELLTQGRPDGNGRFHFAVQPGPVRLVTVAPGRPKKIVDLEVKEGVSALGDLSLPARGGLSFEVSDETAPLPSKLTIESQGEDPDPPKAILGEPPRPEDTIRLVFSHSGSGEVALPPGAYRVTASRGVEYTIDSQVLTVPADGTVSFRGALSKVVDTGEYRSGDFHIHALPSPDSEDLLEMKVQAFAAEGLQIAVSTDHDRLTNYAPAVALLGLDRWLTTFIGDEISTNIKGHFNAFPLALQPMARNSGAVDWFGLTVPAIVELARKANSGDELVQMNHPRGSSAYFNYIEFDPAAGESRNAAEFTTQFDTIEVFNGKRKSDTPKVLQDWYSLLNRGVFIPAVGNSDSHTAAQKQEVGYPRTYIRFPGVSSLSEIDKAGLMKRIRAGDVTVCGGPFVTIEAGDVSMGSTVKAVDGAVEIRVRVQAPPWMDVDTVKLIVNGRETSELSFPLPSSGDVVRLDKMVTVRVATDAWVVEVAEGDGDLGPVVLGTNALSFTNPIFIDADGNGVFDPPR
ncbi:MAG: CehA/McbA family metallohydrolase [Nitrospirae bacterium]|nr:CehA/McbA family metallohydrolase [Nitrospirota bacterium]